MKSQSTIAIWMALTSILVKLILFVIEMDANKEIMIAIFSNLFVVLIGTFFGVRLHKIKMGRPTRNIEDVKSGMRVVAIYSIMMAIFVYAYYSYIDTNYFPQKIENKLILAKEAINEGQEIDLEMVRQQTAVIFSPKTHATITLFGYLAIGLIYTLLVSFFMRKLPGFR